MTSLPDGTIPKDCSNGCNPVQGHTHLPAEVEERFDEEFVYSDLDDETGKRPNRVWRPTFQLPDRETRAIKSFLVAELEKAKQDGRDSLLKELGLTRAWNVTDIKEIQKAEREKTIWELITTLQYGVDHNEPKRVVKVKPDGLSRLYPCGSRNGLGWNKTAEERAITPPGFANEFFKANQ